MAINETLKFSWGHIIAFIAIISISYVSFLGISYLTDGNFLWAGIGVAIIDVLLIGFFIGAQLLKGTEKKFAKRIHYERLLFFCAIFVFCAIMAFPYNHFWTVLGKQKQIKEKFTTSLQATEGIFEDYQSYADSRIKEYNKKLVTTRVDNISRKNKVLALRIQLTGKNYTHLKTKACQWIDKISEATVWNVFMLGNIQKINETIDLCVNDLTELSQKTMSDEGSNVRAFTSQDSNVAAAKANIKALDTLYSTMHDPHWVTCVTGLLLLSMLFLPYFIQKRNTKSHYRLFRTDRIQGVGLEISRSERRDGHEDSSFQIDDSNEPEDENNDYGAFTF